jgi:hypothetical protein
MSEMPSPHSRFSVGDRVFVMGLQRDGSERVGIAPGTCQAIDAEVCRVAFDDGAGTDWVPQTHVFLAEDIVGSWVRLPDQNGNPGPRLILEGIEGDRYFLRSHVGQRESSPIVPFWLARETEPLLAPTDFIPESQADAAASADIASINPAQDLLPTLPQAESSLGTVICLSVIVVVVLAIAATVHAQFVVTGFVGLTALILVLVALRRRRIGWALSTAVLGAVLGFYAYWRLPAGRALSPHDAGLEAKRLAQDFEQFHLRNESRFVNHRITARKFAADYPRHAELLQHAEMACAKRMLQEEAAALTGAAVTDPAPFHAFRKLTDRMRLEYADNRAIWQAAEREYAQRGLDAFRQRLDGMRGADVDQAAAVRPWRDLLTRDLLALKPQAEDAWSRWATRSQAELIETLAKIEPRDLDRFAATATWCKFLQEEGGIDATPMQNAVAAWGQASLKLLQADLIATPAGDFAGFHKGTPTRSRFAGLFPQKAADLQTQESVWGVATADRELAGVKKLLVEDPVAAALHLRKTAEALRACGPQQEAQAKLLKARHGAVASALDRAKHQVRALVKENRFQAADKLAADLTTRVAGEADAVGLATGLVQFRESCEFLAELARRAGKPDPK